MPSPIASCSVVLLMINIMSYGVNHAELTAYYSAIRIYNQAHLPLTWHRLRSCVPVACTSDFGTSPPRQHWSSAVCENKMNNCKYHTPPPNQPRFQASTFACRYRKGSCGNGSLAQALPCSLAVIHGTKTKHHKKQRKPGDNQPCPQALPKNWREGLVTLAKISVCAVLAVFVWSSGITFIHCQLTTFLTRESSRLVPRPPKNGNEASRLFVNLKFQKLIAYLCLLGYCSYLTGFPFGCSVARSAHLLCNAGIVNSSWLPRDRKSHVNVT